MLRWALSRSGQSEDELATAFPRLQAWEAEELRPTFNQLEKFARATRTPIGYFFLGEPPTEEVPIPDFRVVAHRDIAGPSPDLLDVIYTCEQRQSWYRHYAESIDLEPVALVGSFSLANDPIEAAGSLRSSIGFDLDERDGYSTWTDAISGLAASAEDAGILVMISGIVGSNTRRKLDPSEFRGFALSDPLAPLIFINGSDTKAAQVFTLAHEIAHLALGGSALSNPVVSDVEVQDPTERWCDSLGAELLVPERSLLTEFRVSAELTEELDRLARRYKVSSLVVLRRIFEVGLIDEDGYWPAYRAEYRRVTEMAVARSPGGDFYNTTPVRVSKRFARALLADTLEGRTRLREANRLLGFRKLSAFESLADHLGVR